MQSAAVKAAVDSNSLFAVVAGCWQYCQIRQGHVQAAVYRRRALKCKGREIENEER
jgi:hypothetical protein